MVLFKDFTITCNGIFSSYLSSGLGNMQFIEYFFPYLYVYDLIFLKKSSILDLAGH